MEDVCECVFVCVRGELRGMGTSLEGNGITSCPTTYLPVNLQRPRSAQTARGGRPARPRRQMPDTRAHAHTHAQTQTQTNLRGHMFCFTKASNSAIRQTKPAPVLILVPTQHFVFCLLFCFNSVTFTGPLNCHSLTRHTTD